MLICFYFVLFFTAKCLSFCWDNWDECCCDCWNNLWKDCYKESNKEEKESNKEEEKEKNDYLNDYRKAQRRKNLQNIEGIGKQKEKLKNKIRGYLSHIEKEVNNINNNVEKKEFIAEEILNQFSKINELIKNFQNDEYFNTNLIENIQKDLAELQDLCSKANIITIDDFYKKNEEWKKFLEDNGIQEEYDEEQNITPENFSLGNTLEKLKNNFGTYLLEIFKTRLYPINENRDKYKNEFMNFYSDYQIEVFKNTLIIKDSLLNFYRQILQKVKLDYNDDRNNDTAFKSYKDRLLDQNHLYLVYALLTDGDEKNISKKINEKIECKIYSDSDRKKMIIDCLIDSFKRNITEAIKDSVDENSKINKNLQKNNSEEIKEEAFNNYNGAIKNLEGEKIELTFYNSYGKEMETNAFLKNCKLSVLFDYVLSKGREFYASNEDGEIVDEELGYVSYKDEKKKIKLKTALGCGSESFNEAIRNKENITIGEFYEKRLHNVYMFFKIE